MSPPGEVRLSAAGRSDRGQVRDENQDRLLLLNLADPSLQFGADDASVVTPVDFALGEHGAILLVADGVGGRGGGAAASQLVAAEVRRRLVAEPSEGHETSESFVRALTDSLMQANTAVRTEAIRLRLDGMASTATLVGLFQGHAYATQIGDSRAYLVRGTSIVPLTRDQTLVQDLIDSGVMSEDDRHGVADHMILQAVGGAERVRPAVTYHELRRGDLLLLCSDGLSGLISDVEIQERAERAGDLGVLCETLVDLANARGGSDNITLLVARVDGNGLAEPDDSEVHGHQTFELTRG